MVRLSTLYFLGAAIMTASAQAALFVPSQYETLQDAVDASVTGDTIMIAPGTYGGPGFVDIPVNSKIVVIIGSAGADSTLFEYDRDLEEGGFILSDTSESNQGGIVLRGLTFRNAYTTINCGVRVLVNMKSCTFSNCFRVVADTMYVPEIPNVIGNMDSCYVTGSAVGLDVKANSIWEVSNCIFVLDADAISIFSDTGLHIHDNIFAYNDDNVYLAFTDAFHFQRNLFVGNRYAILADLWSTNLLATCNDFYENQDNYWWMDDPVGADGNFAANPMMCDTTYMYPLVMPNSPLLAANNECGVTIGNVSVGCICADIDHSGGAPDIADLTYLVDYMFSGGPRPPFINTADLDGVGGINISDLTMFVDYLFGGGDPPGC